MQIILQMNTLLLSNILEKNANWFTDKWDSVKKSLTPDPTTRIDKYIGPIGIGAGIGALGLGAADALGNHDDEEKNDRVPNLLKSMGLGAVLGGGGGAIYQAGKDFLPVGKDNPIDQANSPRYTGKTPDYTKPEFDWGSAGGAFLTPPATLAFGATLAGIGAKRNITARREMRKAYEVNTKTLPNDLTAFNPNTKPGGQATLNQGHRAGKYSVTTQPVTPGKPPKYPFKPEKFLEDKAKASEQMRNFANVYKDDNNRFTRLGAKKLIKAVGHKPFSGNDYNPFAGDEVPTTAAPPNHPIQVNRLLAGAREKGGTANHPLGSASGINKNDEILGAVKSNIGEEKLTIPERIKLHFTSAVSKYKHWRNPAAQNAKFNTFNPSPLDKDTEQVKEILRQYKLLKGTGDTTMLSTKAKFPENPILGAIARDEKLPFLYRRKPRFVGPLGLGISAWQLGNTVHDLVTPGAVAKTTSDEILGLNLAKKMYHSALSPETKKKMTGN